MSYRAVPIMVVAVVTGPARFGVFGDGYVGQKVWPELTAVWTPTPERTAVVLAAGVESLGNV